ncbi:MAG: bifunctional metallophosphatase/5'-nucleotidase [Magnetococcales bacterium]|nr:bifunctional metallophosphatase/5'-nucleotidase [Magnetococcales bacterium]
MSRWVAVLAWLVPVLGWADPQRVTLLHFNDVYQVDHFARLETIKRQVRQQHPAALLLMSGDFLSPSLMSSIDQGRAMVELFNTVGVDGVTLGNHEFDFGLEVLRERIRESRFHWIVSNLTLANGQPFPGSQTHRLQRLQGVTVGLFGILTPFTKTLVPGLEQVHIDAIVPTSQRMVRQLKEQGADIIVALTHLDWQQDRQLAASVPGIDLILGGHDHEVQHQQVGRTWIIKSGSDLASVSQVQLTRTTTADSWHTEIVSMPVASVAESSTIRDQIQRYQQQLHESMGRTIGTTDQALDTTEFHNRGRETNFGNLVADTLRRALQADVALYTGGSIRSNRMIPAGALTLQDIHRALPFRNKALKLEISGALLRQVLEHGVSAIIEQQGRFLQLSGITMVVHAQRPIGQRVSDVTINAQLLQPHQLYTVAVTDYMARGGDGFVMLQEARHLLADDDAPLVTDRVVDDIRRLSPISPQLEQRIRMEPAH